jgi:N-acetylglucosamine kinase-like BadF-type ATPase
VSESAAVLAVDGGGSKTDVALVARSGRVLGTARGGACTFHPRDHDASMAELTATVRRAADAAGAGDGGRIAAVGAFCLHGADLPVDDRRLLRAMGAAGWAGENVVLNDTFAVLRAGTDRRFGVGLVCGTGLNCAAVGPDGRRVRFPALGAFTGDWGGGGWLGPAALGAASRAADGRGPRTALSRTLPEHLGLRSLRAVIEAIHLGRLSDERVTGLAPVVFATAACGDAVARGLIEALADEAVALVRTCVRRLKMAQIDVDVTLGGGLFRSGDERFLGRVREGVLAAAPKARVIVLTDPPVVGAALLGLDEAGAGPRAAARVRRTLTAERLQT